MDALARPVRRHPYCRFIPYPSEVEATRMLSRRAYQIHVQIPDAPRLLSDFAVCWREEPVSILRQCDTSPLRKPSPVKQRLPALPGRNLFRISVPVFGSPEDSYGLLQEGQITSLPAETHIEALLKPCRESGEIHIWNPRYLSEALESEHVLVKLRS
ncbi:uncharacterized protein M421DRAFT_216624 [Didymella exigua CBS 183.55]|uniref:Uncharacterized protein n=1 Tax=Didymella exigua CBS 183.55 TaxID=1150837 RepID=A0A6A5RH83_9PLEO|nr:uncharacterized protein M421DRAFT_216624 [Didymella exigua CBS 183.55]KAF1926444.1 hypothetical protein M421DRAFT_216624 [Didymella exigua CBS 183.55]